MGDPPFRTDLYRGTAAYYERYRLPYPTAMLDELLARTGATGEGRLLDVACGTGRLTFPLAGRFAEVVAFDQEPDAIARATERAAASAITNVRFSVGRAEDVDAGDGAFDLVTIGTAFHRLDRTRVAERAMGWLRDGGHLALVWADVLQDGDWQRTLWNCATEWAERVDPVPRLPEGALDRAAALPDEVILTDAGFTVLDRSETTVAHDWTVDELIGLVHSTSILPRPLLGDRAPEFDEDLRARLLAVEPSGVFHDEVGFAYDLAARAPRRG